VKKNHSPYNFWIMEKTLNGICDALKNGYSLGCWASGGKVPIVAVIEKDNTTIASGQGGLIKESFEEANKDWLNYKQTGLPVTQRHTSRQQMITGAPSDEDDNSIFGWLDHWVKYEDGYLRVNFESHNNIYIVMLDSYNDNLQRIVQLGFNQDLFVAIENASKAPMQLLVVK